MRTASMILGIIGGAIALILAIILFVGSSFVASFPWMHANDYDWNFNDSDYNWNEDNFVSDDWEWNDDTSSDELDSLLDSLDEYDSNFDPDTLAEIPEMVQNTVSIVFLVPAICAAIAGVLGLIGGIIVKKKNVAAGVLMIIAAVLSLFSFFNIISMALFIVGGVFALMRDRSKQPVYAPPYPMPPNYPQQPYAQQPPYPQPPYQQPYTPPVYPPQPEQPQQPVPPSENPPENPQP